MPEDILSGVTAEPTANATPAANVEPQATTEPTEPVTGVSASVEPATQQPTETKPAQTPEENAAFAKIRREAEAKAVQKASEAEAKARDSVIAEMNMEWNGKPIATYKEYQDAIAEKKAQDEAAKNNVPVEFYTKLTEAERKAQEAEQREQEKTAKLSEFERKENLAKQAEALSKDEVWGEFYAANKDEIHEAADIFKTDLKTAKLIVLNKKGIPKVDIEAEKQKAIQEYIEGKKANHKPVEGSGAASVAVVTAPKSFEEAKKNSLAFIKAQRQT